MTQRRPQRLLEIVRELYRAMLDRDGRMNLAELVDAVRAAVAQDLSLVEVDPLVWGVVELVDHEATGAANRGMRPGVTAAGTQLPMFDEDGALALGEGRRVRHAVAVRPEILEWMAIQTQNHLAETGAYSRKMAAAQEWLRHLPDDTTPLGTI